MTTLAGTAYRRTVGVADEPTVGRATALVAVVMCLAAVSETSYGASNGGLGGAATVAALFVLLLLCVFRRPGRCGCGTATCCLPRRRR